MGRRPKASKFSQGACSILKLSNDGFVEHKDNSICLGKLAGSSPEFESSTYHRQNRAIYMSSITTLASFKQPITDRAAGFPQPTLCLYSPKSPGLGHPQLDRIIGTAPGFFETHRYFVLGANFIDEFQRTVQVLFNHAPRILSSAYSAILQVISHRSLRHVQIDESNLSLGSQCLQYFNHQSSFINDARDAAVTLLLGQILLIYNNLVVCSSTRAITRGALLHTKDWYPTLVEQPQFDSVTFALVVVDVTECLIRRELPVLRFPHTHRLIVDRFLGVCSTLFPLLSDLCERSYAVKMQTPLPSTDDSSGDPYSEIEYSIRNWEPPIPKNFFKKYSAVEAVLILGQARAYRTAALLVIHRLRFPFGVEDDYGSRLAIMILDELSILSKRPTDGATGMGLDFPLLVALVELPEAGQEVLKEYESLRFRRQQSEEILAFVSLVWKRYEDGYSGLWFDLVDGNLPDMLFP